jgi:RimJ/RimL family protein N-acetyltransferase
MRSSPSPVSHYGTMISGEELTLTGSHVQLEPLSLDHVHQLVVAANEDRSTYGWTPVPETVAAMTSYVAALLADAEAHRVIPFAQRRLSDLRVVGCTRFLEIRYWTGRDLPDEVEIGGTWLAASAQRTPINTEAKLLLMTQAFQEWEVRRLAIYTDSRNSQSRDAIERTGATFEGILRNHRASAVAGEIGQQRDTAAHSILDREWPRVKEGLVAKLAPR